MPGYRHKNVHYNVEAKMVDGYQNSEKVRPSKDSTIEGKSDAKREEKLEEMESPLSAQDMPSAHSRLVRNTRLA